MLYAISQAKQCIYYLVWGIRYNVAEFLTLDLHMEKPSAPLPMGRMGEARALLYYGPDLLNIPP